MRYKNLSITELDKKYFKKNYLSLDGFNKQIKFKDYEYIYEKVLNKIIKFLNKSHNYKKDNLYWRIIIGPWLSSYIACFLDRLNTVDIFFKNKRTRNKYLIFDFKKKIDFKFKSCFEFAEIAKNYDEWNHKLFLKILKFRYPNKIKIINKIAFKKPKTREFRSNYFELSLIRFFLKIYFLLSKNIIFDFIPNKKNIFYFLLNFKNILSENMIKKLFPSYFEKLEIKTANEYLIYKNQFRQIKSIKKIKTIDSLIYKSALEEIPSNYLENFIYLKKKCKNLKVKNKKIFSFSSQISSDFYKIWIAENKNSNKIFVFDHGGGLRAKDDCQVNHEEIISDKIYTWSDLKSIYLNSKQVSPYKIIKLNNISNFKNQNNISIISPSVGKYVIWASSRPSLNQFNKDVNLIFSCHQKIKDEVIKKKMIIKLPFYSNDYHYYKASVKFWKKNFINCFVNKIKFYKLEKQLEDLAKTSRLIILMSPQTTLSEVLITNTPFILLFKSNHWPLNSLHQKVLNKCKNLIYFDDAKKAALFLEKNYKNVDAWWSSKKIKNLRKYLKKNICNAKINWAQELKKITS